jgi:hypothetical protein
MADYFASLAASNRGFDQGAASAAANQRIAEQQAQALRDDQQRRIGQDMATSAFMQPAPSFDPSTVVGLKLPTVTTPMADPSKVKLMEDYSVPAPPPPPTVVENKPAAPATLNVPKPDAPPTPAEQAKTVRPTTEILSVPTEQLSVAEFKSLPPAERAKRLQIENDRRALSRIDTSIAAPPAAAFDIAALPFTAAAKGVESVANAVNFARFGRAVGLYDPDVTSVTVPGSGSITPFTDRLRKSDAENQPLTEEQFIKNLAAAETKSRGPRVVNEALNGYALPDNLNKRFTNLSNIMPQKLQEPKLRGLVARAMQLGVDPATAVATYALENNYGSNAESPKGARGPLQIMPGTYSDMRAYYIASKDPALAALGNSLPLATTKTGNQYAWNNDVKLTTAQTTDAGLLYMKYLKEVKNIPTNLMGAAYHAGANYDSYKNGFAPNVVDAGVDSKGRRYSVWTPDYNAVHVGLYNQYAALTNGTTLDTPTTANGVVGKGQDARNPVAATQQVVVQNSGATREVPSQVQMVNQPNAAAPVVPAAAVVPTAEVKAPVLEQIRVATNTPVEAYDAATKQLMSRHELITRQMGEGSKILDNSTRTNAVNLQAARTQINNEARAAYAVGNTTIMNQKLRELQGVDAQIRQLDTTYRSQRMEFERQALGSTQTIENELWKVQSDLAIRDLSNGDPRRMVQVARNYTKMPMDVQRRSDGNYNIYYPDPKNPGQMVTDPNKPKTAQELSAWFLSQTSDTYRTNKATADALLMSKAAEIQLQTNADIQKKLSEQIGTIRIDANKGAWDAYVKQVEKSGDYTTTLDTATGRYFILPKDGSGRVFSFDPNRPMTGPDGTIKPEAFKLEFTMPTSNVGLNTAGRK